MHVYYGQPSNAEVHRIHLDAQDYIEHRGEQMAPQNPYEILVPGFAAEPARWVVARSRSGVCVRSIRWRVVL